MFNTRKRILVFNLLPIDNGPHVQQNDIFCFCAMSIKYVVVVMLLFCKICSEFD